MANWANSLDRMNRRVRDRFGVSAVYLPKAGGSHAIVGIFDEAHVKLGPDPGVADTETIFTVRLADLSAVGVTPHNYDLVTISGRSWQVGEVRPDGSGMAALVLGVA